VLVAVLAPVAFIVALEILIGLVRRGRGSPSPQGAPAAPDQCPHLVAPLAPLAERATAAWLHVRDCEGQEPVYREIGRQLGEHHATVAKMVRAALTDAAVAGQPSAAAAGQPATAARASANGSHGG
jgi:hypothetical protein